MVTMRRPGIRPGRIPGKPSGMPIYERFMTLVDTSGGPEACHLWTGTRQRSGYGRFTVDGKKVTAARWLLGHLRGEPLLPREFALHRCDNPPCVNPAHLYVGSATDNVRDMVTRGRNSIINARREATHCLRGHEFTPENTGVYGGSRHCKACDRLRSLTRDRSKTGRGGRGR